MLVRVLGSAAGGGFPQWNCGCSNCAGVRRGSVHATPRTQESVAVSADGQAWFLLNASPEVRQQIEATAVLHPRGARDTPIEAVVLTNGDLDHCLGLLSLRESERFSVYATDRVRRGFVDGNVFARTLERFEGQISWRTLHLSREQPLLRRNGTPSGLTVRALPVPGKPPLHLQNLTPDPEDNIALRIRDERSGAVVSYVSGVGGPSPAVSDVVVGADAVFFDGTFWSSDELIALGVGERRAEDMAHWPVGGDAGSIRMLAALKARHRILIHINNTNPLLIDDSPERAFVERAGITVAYDGLELSL